MPRKKTTPKPTIEPGAVVLVEWEDAHMALNEEEAEEWGAKPVPLSVVGHVVSLNETGIQLGMEKAPDDSYRLMLFIPRGMVRTVTELTRGNPLWTSEAS